MLQESLVYRLIYSIFSYFGKVWQHSFMAYALNKTGCFFRAVFSGSAIVSFLTREGAVGCAYSGSFLYKFIDGLINLPQRILHPLYKKVKDVFCESIFFKVVLYILDRLHLLIAGFLFLALIFPYNSLNNLYSSIAMSGLLVF